MSEMSNQDILRINSLCYRLCKCYRYLDNQSYCGATGKLTTEGNDCYALISTKVTHIERLNNGYI